MTTFKLVQVVHRCKDKLYHGPVLNDGTNILGDTLHGGVFYLCSNVIRMVLCLRSGPTTTPLFFLISTVLGKETTVLVVGSWFELSSPYSFRVNVMSVWWFACSPHDHVGLLWVIKFPYSSQKHVLGDFLPSVPIQGEMKRIMG